MTVGDGLLRRKAALAETPRVAFFDFGLHEERRHGARELQELALLRSTRSVDAIQLLLGNSVRGTGFSRLSKQFRLKAGQRTDT